MPHARAPLITLSTACMVFVLAMATGVHASAAEPIVSPSSAPAADTLDVSHCGPIATDCVSDLRAVQNQRNLYEQERLGLAFQRARLDDLAASSAHRRRAFQAQYIASWIVLALVVAIVASGLFMSWRQLLHGMATGKVGESNMEMSASGFKLQSSVIGLVIFLASLAFFSIYIDKVYTISVLQNAPDLPPAGNGAPPPTVPPKEVAAPAPSPK